MKRCEAIRKAKYENGFRGRYSIYHHENWELCSKIPLHTHTHIHIYLSIHTHRYIHAYVCVCVYVYTYINCNILFYFLSTLQNQGYRSFPFFKQKTYKQQKFRFSPKYRMYNCLIKVKTSCWELRKWRFYKVSHCSNWLFFKKCKIHNLSKLDGLDALKCDSDIFLFQKYVGWICLMNSKRSCCTHDKTLDRNKC